MNTMVIWSENGSSPYMFIPTQPFGGKNMDAGQKAGKKVSYLMEEFKPVEWQKCLTVSFEFENSR